MSALKLPSVTGSCPHPTGTGLAAILFGPAITAVLGTIVLLYHALFLAHGGMVAHAMKRISDYAEKSGIEINVGVAGSGNCGE